MGNIFKDHEAGEKVVSLGSEKKKKRQQVDWAGVQFEEQRGREHWHLLCVTTFHHEMESNVARHQAHPWSSGPTQLLSCQNLHYFPNALLIPKKQNSLFIFRSPAHRRHSICIVELNSNQKRLVLMNCIHLLEKNYIILSIERIITFI